MSDNLSVANRKIRVNQSNLESELKRISREHVIEARMHNNLKQRFKNKYAKLDVFDDTRGSEASDVVMYETHNPGFCYRRNGDCRLQQSTIRSCSLDMEDLRLLLFTKDEVDLDKVLCLYMLTAHKVETIKAPPRSQRASFLGRQQSPLERLVDRSKKRTFESEVLKILPLYVIDTPMEQKEPVKDQRLLSKILINNKILQMVNAVRSAFETANSDILQDFITVAKNPDSVRFVLSKPKIQNFIKSLYGQNIVSNCESFHLEYPSNVKTFISHIEPLNRYVRALRRNILLMPGTNCWKIPYEMPNNASKSTKGSAADVIIYRKPEEEKSSVSGAPTSSVFAFFHPPCSKDVEFVLDYDESTQCGGCLDDTGENSSCFRIVQPVIKKNVQKGFSAYTLDEDSEEKSEDGEIERLELDELADLLDQKVKKEARKDAKLIMESPRPRAAVYRKTAKESPIEKPKFSLRRTMCEACMQKWKAPLPAPKTSKLRKLPIPAIKDSSFFTSKSTQRISQMIDEEVRRFESSGKPAKPEAITLSNRYYATFAKGNYLLDTSIEIIDLDELELAKIHQEIKENETRKKLAAFMARDLNASL